MRVVWLYDYVEDDTTLSVAKIIELIQVYKIFRPISKNILFKIIVTTL